MVIRIADLIINSDFRFYYHYTEVASQKGNQPGENLIKVISGHNYNKQ